MIVKIEDQPLRELLKDVHTFLDYLKTEQLPEGIVKKRDDLIRKFSRITPDIFPPLFEEDVYDDAEETCESPVMSLKSSTSSSTLDKDTTSLAGVNRSSRISVTSRLGKEEADIPDKTISAFTNPLHAGYLFKKRPEKKLLSRLSPYQKRYCIVDGGVMFYYESASSKKQCGAFRLTDYEMRPASHLMKDQHLRQGCFELVSPGKRSYVFYAKNFDEMKDWYTAVAQSSTVHHPDVSTLVKPDEVPDTSSKQSEIAEKVSSIKESIDTNNIDLQEEYDDVDDQPAQPVRRRPAVPPEEIYDDGEEEHVDEMEETYDDMEAEEEYDAIADTPAKTKSSLPVPKEDIPKRVLPEISAMRNRPLPEPTPPSPRKQIAESTRQGSRRELPPPPVQKNITLQENDYGNMFYGMWDCSTSKQHELSFAAGDIIQIIDREYEVNGWWTGYLGGKVGLVPKAYMQAAYVLAY